MSNIVITDDIKYVGVNDHKIDLFEGQYNVKSGMSYNSYVIEDEKIAVLDTCSEDFKDEWLSNIKNVLGKREPSYLVVHHMEGDHSANIKAFTDKYPKVTVVSSLQAFTMMKNYFGTSYDDRRVVIKDGDSINLGKHMLTFVACPMVHWPEVMMSYDSYSKILFSADAFGKFGANDKNDLDNWDDEARRYYIGIVGKYGVQVQKALSTAKTLDIKTICSLHGPILKGDLSHYINLYDTWSSYKSEMDGVLIAYTSIYGHTKKAAYELKNILDKKNVKNVVIKDIARSDIYECVADAFKYPKLVIATTSYNGEIFPVMKHFIDHLISRNYQDRKIGIIDNGSWAPCVTNIVKKSFENSKKVEFLPTVVKIQCAMNDANKSELEKLGEELSK